MTYWLIIDTENLTNECSIDVCLLESWCLWWPFVIVSEKKDIFPVNIFDFLFALFVNQLLQQFYRS